MIPTPTTATITRKKVASNVPLPSILVPHTTQGQAIYSDLLLRMKIDIGSDAMNIDETQFETDHPAENWSQMTQRGSHDEKPTSSNTHNRIKYTPCHSRFSRINLGTKPLLPHPHPTSLKEYAAKIVARAFKTAVQRKRDLDDWLDLVRLCGDSVKLEVWKAILDEGYMRSGGYLWTYDLLGVRDSALKDEFISARKIAGVHQVIR